MQIESIVKQIFDYLNLPPWAALAALAAVFAYGQWKRRVEHQEKTKSEKIQRFVDQFPEIRGPNKAILSEQLFHDVFGKDLTYPEIQYFLATKTPTRNIRHFLSARAYFERSPDRPALKERFGTKERLRFAKWHRIFWYGIFSMAGLTLIANSQPVFKGPPFVWAAALYLIFTCLLLAYQFLTASVDIDNANELREALGLDRTEPSSDQVNNIQDLRPQVPGYPVQRATAFLRRVFQIQAGGQDRCHRQTNTR